jgi:hypothetical protein
MLRLEVGPEALLGRVKGCQAGVERGDQSPRVARVEGFGRDQQAQVGGTSHPACSITIADTAPE